MLLDAMADRTISLRLRAEDDDRLARLTEHFAVNPTNLIRMLLKQAADALPAPAQPAKTPARPGPKKR